MDVITIPTTFLFATRDSLDRMANYRYRIRGYYRKSKKEIYVSRTRYKTKGEAEANKDAFASKWKNISIVGS